MCGVGGGGGGGGKQRKEGNVHEGGDGKKGFDLTFVGHCWR